jgi:type VI secretion system protein ImpM
MTGAASVGFFGKLPCKGDFLQRRAPQEFVDTWDPWLQECIHASRQALQDGWLDAYLTGPVWRFVISSGVCGSGAYAGVMLPSVDRVGRYFPLTLVTQVDTDESPVELACRGTAWFDAAEALAIAALEATDLDLDAFDEQVASLSTHLPRNNSGHTATLWSMQEEIRFPTQGFQWQISLPSAHDLQTAVNVLSFRVLAGQLRPMTLWWTDGASAVSPSWLVMRGLPAPGSFTAMLAGQWRHWGWNSSDLAFEPAQAYMAPANDGDLSPLAPMQSSIRAAEPVNSGVATPLDIGCEAPTTRVSAIAENRAAYVSRPECGLWAVATPGDGDVEAVQMVADLLNQVPDSGSLSSLVESARTALHAGHKHLVQRSKSQAHTLAVIVKGNEGAVLSAGALQLMCARGNELHPIVDSVAPAAAQAAPASSSDDSPGGSLMGLLEADGNSSAPIGAERFSEVSVRYEQLVAGDAWILFGQPTVDDLGWSRLAALVASGMPLGVASIAETLGHAQDATPPLLLLKVSSQE